MHDARKLVLFDIDGTLISAGGAGTRSMNRAFHALFGISDAFQGIPMAGKTDPQIMKEGLITYGYDSRDGNVEQMKDLYLHFLQEEIGNPLKHLKPGIQEAIRALQFRGIPVGLLTGNLERGAEIKLTPFGIYEAFLDGAFGSDDEDRDKLLPVAIDKFKKHGYGFAPQDCVIIGDTPRDVQCAKIHGAQCIAVATGPYTKGELEGTDADLVVDSLEDIGAFMHHIIP